MTLTDEYVTDDATGGGWRMMLGDSCERLAEIPDASIDLGVHSPPFPSVYTYSGSLRDLGNADSFPDFMNHYRFVIDELYRVHKPGRIHAVHVQQVAAKKAVHGFVGLLDFRGDVIREWQRAGWIYYGEVTIPKQPQAQAIRMKITAEHHDTQTNIYDGFNHITKAFLRELRQLIFTNFFINKSHN